MTARLVANVTGLQAGLATGATSVRAFSSELEQNARKNSQGFQQIGLAVGAMGAATLLGVGMAVNAFAAFDEQMSHVQAATHETAGAMGQLKDAALDAGAQTAFSATEAAAGIEELAKAGLSTADIMGGALAGSLDLAAAGGLSVAEAAETTATALSIFRLEGGQATHVADLLAAAAGKAQGDVHDMGAALNQSALLANNMGISIEDATGALALFAAAGLKGSDAGTSFRQMLLHLTNPSEEARDAMRELGISVYDAQGNFTGLEDLAGQLQSRMTGLDQETRDAALATIFGADAVRAASILYQEGSAGVAEWAGKVDDAGYAAETAALRMDNLRGDLEKLSGSVETALIGLGEQGDGIARGIVQGLTDLVNTFGQLPDGAQAAVLAVAGLVGVVGLLGGAALILIPKIHATKLAMAELGLTARGTAVALGTATAALGLLALAYVGLEALDPKQSIDALTASLKDLAATGDIAGALAKIDSGLFGVVGTAGNLAPVLREAREEMDNWWDAADSLVGTSAGEDIASIDAALAGLVSSGSAAAAARSFDEIAAFADEAGLSYQELIELFPQYAAAAEAAGVGMSAYAEGARAALDEQKLLSKGLEGVGSGFDDMGAAAVSASEEIIASHDGSRQSIEEELTELESLIEAYNTLNGTVISAAESEANYQQAIDDTVEGIAALREEHDGLGTALNATKTGFDLNTQAGRDLQGMFLDQAKAAVTAAEGAHELALQNGEGIPAANDAMMASLEASRSALSLTMQDAGLTKEAADHLAESIIGIPDISTTNITADTTEEEKKTADTKARLAALEVLRTAKIAADPANALEGIGQVSDALAGLTDKTIHIWEYTHHIDQGEGGGGGVSTGGRIGGYSPSDTADNIHKMLTAGEYVLPVRAVRALEQNYGTSFLEHLRHGRVGALADAASGRRMAGQTTIQFPTYLAPTPVSSGSSPAAAGASVTQTVTIVNPTVRDLVIDTEDAAQRLAAMGAW